MEIEAHYKDKRIRNSTIFTLCVFNEAYAVLEDGSIDGYIMVPIIEFKEHYRETTYSHTDGWE
jgi:hypothetical protein